MPKKINMRSAVRADEVIGQKIRLRRVEIKLSQDELGKALGVSFQQVQKYEKGVNRVGAARLAEIARVLKVPMSFFYDADTAKEAEVQSLLFIDSGFSLRLLRAYSGIKSQEIQRKMVSLMESLSGNAVA